ncbi:hypothetical protein NE237_002681 [Protea cynaroides]|uniref:Uncharacterized protein n=1 Tax=Protea cynaroides TaxID=273540 RepID=A0A9Q0GKW3_9MAGN|nr:hypothetical protein NE237_002681 [Protea cynaroides]
MKSSEAEGSLEEKGTQPRKIFSNPEITSKRQEEEGKNLAEPKANRQKMVEPETENVQEKQQHEWCQVRAKKKRPDGSMDQNPQPPGSSAGHTPYLNRASNLARDKRLEQLRKYGPAKQSGPLDLSAGPNAGPTIKPPSSSILKSLSYSRSKNGTGGAGTRKPEGLIPPSPSKNREKRVGETQICPFQTWEGDHIFVSMGEKCTVKENAIREMNPKAPDQRLKGKESMEEEGWDLAHQT